MSTLLFLPVRKYLSKKCWGWAHQGWLTSGALSVSLHSESIAVAGCGTRRGSGDRGIMCGVLRGEGGSDGEMGANVPVMVAGKVWHALLVECREEGAIKDSSMCAGICDDTLLRGWGWGRGTEGLGRRTGARLGRGEGGGVGGGWGWGRGTEGLGRRTGERLGRGEGGGGGVWLGD